jgi:hypothetical protein
VVLMWVTVTSPRSMKMIRNCDQRNSVSVVILILTMI